MAEESTDQVTASGERLWGGETDKAVANFPVSGHPVPAPVIHWLGRIKAAAARTNAELELLDAGHAPSGSPPPATQSAAASTTISSPSTSSRPAPAPPRT